MQAVRQQRRLTNAEYQQFTGTSRPTAKRNLEYLVNRGLLLPGGAGRGAFYAIPAKRVGNGSNGSSENGVDVEVVAPAALRGALERALGAYRVGR